MELFEALEQDNTEGGVEVNRRAQLDGLPPIKVVGSEGGGCNGVKRLVQARIAGVEFVGVNTDAQALQGCDAETRIRIGDRISRGLGVGGDPDRGRAAAEESREELKDALKGADMVFITAGIGGGTGTGGAPPLARGAEGNRGATLAGLAKAIRLAGGQPRPPAE